MFGKKNQNKKYQKKLDTLKNKYKKLIAKGNDKSKAKANKIMEEIKKMVKLGLKDGRITELKEEGKKDNAMVQPVPQEAKQEQEVSQNPVQSNQSQQVQQAVPELNPFDEAIMQQQRPQPMQQQPMQQPVYQQPVQPVQQPMYQQPVQPIQQPVPDIKVTITLEGNRVVPVIVPGAELETFLQSISEAIDNQSSIQIGTKVINGRYIVDYDF